MYIIVCIPPSTTLRISELECELQLRATELREESKRTRAFEEAYTEARDQSARDSEDLQARMKEMEALQVSRTDAAVKSDLSSNLYGVRREIESRTTALDVN